MSRVRYFSGAKLAATDEPLDLLVEGGQIAAAGRDLEVPGGADRVDACGKLLLPGACDLHAHLMAPGGGAAETWESASAAARAGGVSRVLAMPDAPTPVDQPAVVRARMDEIEARADIAVHLAAALTCGFDGQRLTNFHELKEHGVHFLCDPGRAIENPSVLRRAMDYARDFDLIFGLCPATPALAPRGCVNEGRMSYELGLPGDPVCGEDIAVARDVRLAESVGARVHLQCLSSARAVHTVRRAKERGMAVTAEVNVHHLLFDETAVGDYDTTFKLRPPLRLAEDCEALLNALVEGTIDCLVSAHLPRKAFTKAQDFISASDGMTGLQTTIPALFDRLISAGRLSWADLVRVYSDRPREILGLAPIRFTAGESAEFFLFDPEGETQVSAASQHSLSLNTPFLGQTLKGEVIVV